MKEHQRIRGSGHYIRHRNNELWVDRFDGSELFRKDSTFQFRPPLGGSL